jgi:predicted MFS family arabinose efflux permease
MSETKKAGAGPVAVILTLFNFVIMIPYLGPAALLGDIMGDLGADISMGGLVISIYLIMCGLCMFVGSVVCNKIGFRETFILGCICVTLGLFVSAISLNFALYFIGRLISGIGYGLAQVSMFPVAAIWFEGPKFATMQTIIVAGASLGVALAYIVFPLFGAWKTATWVFAIITLVYTLASVLWFKYPAGVGEHMKQARADAKAGSAPKQKTEFGRVFKYKNFVLILIISIFSIVPSTILLSYMVTFFTEEVGMSLALASTVSSLLTVVQLAGSILGGVLINATSRRKPFIVISVALYGLSTIGLVLFGNANITWLVITCAVINGVSYYLRMPALGMYMVEETETPEPAFVAPISAITNGVPMLLTLVGSIIGGMMISSMGTGSTILITHIVALAMVIPALLLTEVGPKSKRAKAAEAAKTA